MNYPDKRSSAMVALSEVFTRSFGLNDLSIVHVVSASQGQLWCDGQSLAMHRRIYLAFIAKMTQHHHE